MSARKDLAAELKPLLPRKWKLVDHDRNLDEANTVVVLLSQREIAPAVNAQGAHKVTFLIRIIDPHDAPGAAEDSLDDGVDTLLYALDALTWVRWTTAQKVVYDDHRSYEINLEAFTERKD